MSRLIVIILVVVVWGCGVVPDLQKMYPVSSRVVYWVPDPESGYNWRVKARVVGYDEKWLLLSKDTTMNEESLMGYLDYRRIDRVYIYDTLGW